MAPYFRDPNLEDDQDGANVQLSGSGQQSDGAGGFGGPAGPSGPGVGRETGSKFTNLETYLNSNDAKGFGQQFGQKIQGGIDQAGQTMDQAAAGVRGQIMQSGSAPSQKQIDDVISGAGDNTSDADVNQYQGWLNASYKGPKSLADNQSAWNQYWGQANKAKTEAGLAGKESGRFALLDQYYGRPSYNFGQKSLDNLLVQSGGGFTNQKQLQDQATALQSRGVEQGREIQNLAGQKSAEIEAGKQAARSAIGLVGPNNSLSGGPIKSLEQSIESRKTDYNKQIDDRNKAYRDDLADNKVTNPELQALLDGVNPGTVLYGANPADYINQGAYYDKNAAATKEEYAKYQALSRLAGLDPSYLAAGKGSEIGVAPSKDSFDKNRFESVRSGNEAIYKQSSATVPIFNGHTMDELTQSFRENEAYGAPSLEVVLNTPERNLNAKYLPVVKAIKEFMALHGANQKYQDLIPKPVAAEVKKPPAGISASTSDEKPPKGARPVRIPVR